MHLTARTACVLAGLCLLPAAVTIPNAEPVCQAAFYTGRPAGPLNREWVDKNASWVFHLDVEAAMESALGRFLRANREHLDLGPFDQIRKQTGFDPLTDLKSVTVYGTRDQAGERIRIIRATPALDAAIAKMRQPDILVQAITTGTWSLEAWSQDDWQRFGYVTEGLDASDRLLIFSGNQFTTARALDVQAGRAANITELEGSALATTPPKGSILFIAAEDVPALLGTTENESVVGTLARELIVNVGQTCDSGVPGDEDCCVNVTLRTRNFADASKLTDVLRGAVTVGKQFNRNEASWAGVRALLDGVYFHTDDSAVSVTGKWKAQAIVQALQSHGPAVAKPAVAGGGNATAPPWFADLYSSQPTP